MSNEAAERLRWHKETGQTVISITKCQEAVVAERRATVERLRARAEGIEHPCHDACVEPFHADCQCAAWMRQEVLAILDAEAQR